MELYCSTCKELKDESKFSKNKNTKRGFNYICKYCKDHSEQRKKATKRYREKYREKLKIIQKNYYSNPVNKEKKKKSVKEWQAKTIIERRRKVQEKRDNNMNFRLSLTLRTRINAAIKTARTNKNNSSGKLIGYTIPELKTYLESKFLPTMTWENYGRYWHIDHIIPCCKFDLTKEEEQLKCFHYTNLQPLFAITQVIDNIEYIGNLNKQGR
jgi:hypothetical protein